MIQGIKKDQNWHCPYCGSHQVISEKRFDRDMNALHMQGWEQGFAGYIVEAIVCSNDKCKKMSVNFAIIKRTDYTGNGWTPQGKFEEWRLLPASFAKPQPDFIPEPLRNDYAEACAIRDLSPKASATLTRRCIQGIIRDFCKISKNRLVEEVDELVQQVADGKAPPGVQADTVQAIDEVRKIGNIGAHMEKDINVIIDVDPDEAQALIELTELLFAEWYVEREKRAQKIGQIGVISAAKKAAQKQKDSTPTSE